MSEEKKDEDFVGMLKRMKSDMDTPSVIGDALEKLEKLQNENAQLREQLSSNIDLISSSEDVLKKTLEEKEKLKEERKNALEKYDTEVNAIKSYNIELSEQNTKLENSLREKTASLIQMETELSELRVKAENATRELEEKKKFIPQTDSTISQALVEDLSSKLAKMKLQLSDYESKVKNLDLTIKKLTQENEMYRSRISSIGSTESTEIPTELTEKTQYISQLESKIQYLDSKINELNAQNTLLNQKLEEKMQKENVDYVVPVVEATTVAKKVEPAPQSVSTLEILCQDLQSDLNKYKRVMENLKMENERLKSSLESSGVQPNIEEISTLRNENTFLKEELGKLKQSIEMQTAKAAESDEFQMKIQQLQDDLKQKESYIEELKSKASTPVVAEGKPMAGLVEDLQANINKLKLVIKEKDKRIDELSK